MGPNVENAVSLCQQVCQIQEGCNFFKYNSALEKCELFHYRYLDSCQLGGGTATPTLDDSSAHLCNFFTVKESTCDTMSGPALPDIDSCSGPTSPNPVSTVKSVKVLKFKDN